ncbi:hypothetical protein [Actinomadura flavalba]|uniref:hypothetical protein n=1 Tax=Actinomadura flavalba TaxID=1120938 RepID=UPI00039E8D45|nr:hypothetical protein [Actinomadura flavalba]
MPLFLTGLVFLAAIAVASRRRLPFTLASAPATDPEAPPHLFSVPMRAASHDAPDAGASAGSVTTPEGTANSTLGRPKAPVAAGSARGPRTGPAGPGVPAPHADVRQARAPLTGVTDPFALPVWNLDGPGALAAARALVLCALEHRSDDVLLVMPRADASALFELADDDLLDEESAALFLSGNLDVALGLLETELAARSGDAPARPGSPRHLVLVADCGAETARVERLLLHRSSSLTSVLLGGHIGDALVVDADGRIAPGTGMRTPRTLETLRFPVLTPSVARDRLYEVLPRQRATRRRSAPRTRTTAQ